MDDWHDNNMRDAEAMIELGSEADEEAEKEALRAFEYCVKCGSKNDENGKCVEEYCERCV